jgi:predicted nuclease of predicted toxin-antitoxin system
MGIPFCSTFIYRYLLQSTNNLKQINLTDQYVIIDGNSFMHFIYKTIMIEDQKKPMAQRLIGTPFGYDGCWKVFHDTLSLFKKKCLTVDVIFDGISKSNPYRRPDPNRPYSPYFVDDEKQERLPTLLRHEFMNILRELKIEIIVARSEADPVIVRRAREKNAYIVAYDSDYHLYQLSEGFVSLRYLNLKTLTGPSFQMVNVFGRMNAKGVALWATLIANKFVSFKNLQVTVH